MTIGGAFLGGGVELVPAGSCKLVMEIRTEDGANLATTFSVVGGGQTYTATAGADGRAELTVPSGVTYTVTTSATGYDGLAAQTVIGDSATVQYVRFEAILPRVKKSGDTMTGVLELKESTNVTISIEKGQAGAGKYRDFTFYDKGDANGANRIRRGNIRCEVGNVQTAVHLRAYTFDGSTGASLTVIQPETGDACALAPSWGIKTVDGATVGTNDESDKIVTLKMLSLDPKVVHSVGAETIGGAKTFTGLTTFKTSGSIGPLIEGYAPYSTFKDIGVEQLVSTHPYIAPRFRFVDKNEKQIGRTGVGYTLKDGVGTSTLYMTASALKSDGTSVDANLNVIAKSNGTIYANAPTTPSGATGNEIATANWSIGKFVQKSGDTMSGNLTIQRASTPYLGIRATEGSYGDVLFYDSGSNRSAFVRGEHTSEFNRLVLGCSPPNGNTINYTMQLFNHATDGTYVLAPTPSDKAENSDKIATTAWINSADVICRTAGNQTVGGTKTFTARPNINRATESGIIYNATDFDRDVTPTEIIRPWDCVMQAKGGVWFGRMTYYVDTNNKRVLSHEIYDTKGTSRLELVSKDGVRYATAPTTPTNATGNEIATADWVLGKLGSGVLKKIDLETTIADGSLYINNLQVGDIVVLNFKTGSNGSYSGAFTYTGTESQQSFGSNVSFLKPSSGTPYIESSYIWISNNGGTSARLSCLYDKYVLGGTTYTSGTGNIHTPSGFILRG